MTTVTKNEEILMRWYKYHIEEVNVDNSKCADAGHTLTGALLVNRGLEHRMVKKYTSSVFLLTAE